ncbi:MAG: hypothetical protein LQ346_001080 [Caloplaca aetnensis]|nr:MAG: hypothetical protein LQ346_001080 [Caloplaca aetnensis]
MVFIPFQFRWQQALFFVGTISLSLITRNETNLVHDGPEHVLARNAVASGSKHVVDSSRFHRRTDVNNRSLVKRAGTLSYENAWANGAAKLQKIQQGNPNPPRVVQEDFDDSGWTIADDFDREIPKELTSMAEALKILPKPEDIHRVEAHQYSEFTNQNGDRHSGDDPSGGQYLETYVPKYGVIFASQNISPEQTIIQDRIERKMPAPTKEELREHVPELNRWSDGIIDQITGSETNAFYLPWPGKTFDISKPPSDCGKSRTEGDLARALLGTAHGAGIAWMMADHKDILGDRSLKITIFNGKDPKDMFKPTADYYMLFELVKP